MSRVGNQPIRIPNEVSVTIDGNFVRIEGPKGEQEIKISNVISVKVEEDLILCSREGDDPDLRAKHGLTRSLINNGVIGVSEGFEKILVILGTGYRVTKKGKNLEFSLGFSHLITVTPIGSNELNEQDQNTVLIQGVSKQEVGEQAARIRKLRKPNPYTGNGIKYRGEIIRRKAGKTAVGGEM